MSESHDTIHGTWKSYILGLVLSVLFTLGAYFIVVEHMLPIDVIMAAIITLALAQAVVQLILFLHLGDETKPRSKLFMFLLMILILVIVIIGTLWIMFDLNNRMMPMMHMGK